MLKQIEFRVLTLLAVATLLVAVANVVLFGQNRERQQEVASRGQFIQQSVQLEGLYREIVKALADLAVRGNDKQISEMLAKQGISVTASPAPAVAPASMPAAADVKKAGK